MKHDQAGFYFGRVDGHVPVCSRWWNDGCQQMMPRPRSCSWTKLLYVALVRPEGDDHRLPQHGIAHLKRFASAAPS
jgi:hypothetical protein